MNVRGLSKLHLVLELTPKELNRLEKGKSLFSDVVISEQRMLIQIICDTSNEYLTREEDD